MLTKITYTASDIGYALFHPEFPLSGRAMTEVVRDAQKSMHVALIEKKIKKQN